MPRRPWSALVWAVLGVITAAARAQVPADDDSDTPPPADAGVRIAQVELARLVDLASSEAGVGVDYEASLLKGSVTVRLDRGLGAGELWSLMNQVLAQRGFTTVRQAGSPTLSVVKLADASSIAMIEEPGTGAGAFGPGFQRTAYRSQHKSAKALAESIRPLLSKPGGTAQEVPESGVVVVGELSSRMGETMRLLALIDVPAEDAAIERVEADSLSPTALAAVVMQVLAKGDLAAGTKSSGEVLPGPDGRSVLIVAPRDRLAHLRELVRDMDRREAVETRTYRPRVFPPADVARLLESTVRGGGVGGGGGGGGVADERWRLVIDDLTGSLIVTATPSQLGRVEELVERLDSAERGPTPVRAFAVRNRPVGEVIETLGRLIDAGVLEASSLDRAAVSAGSSQSSPRGGGLFTPEFAPPPPPPPSTAQDGSQGGAAPAPSSGANRVGDQGGAIPAGTVGGAGVGGGGLTLTADEQTNTLIAIGDPRVLAQIEALLAVLDVRQPQVMLEVLLVSLSESDTVNLGVELERIGSIGNATTRLASLFGLSTLGAGGVRAVGDGIGFTGAVLNPGEFSLIVRALQTITRGRSMSSPRLLVTNNERAVFSSVLQQPVTTTITSNTSTQTTFAGTEDAGTTISVRPQIAQGDHLVLTYSIRLSSFVGTSSSAGIPPPKQQNTVDSVATIPDGHIVVVGGLELVSDGSNVDQIPLIGSIPGLGELFKNRRKSTERQKFFVFIRATVLRSAGFEDLKYLGSTAAKQLGVDDGLPPPVQPRVIK